MTKQERIDPELKQAINFSDLNSLDEGLEVALRLKWSEFSINDVPEDKIESSIEALELFIISTKRLGLLRSYSKITSSQISKR